jgi:beta-catenin-like protein 1
VEKEDDFEGIHKVLNVIENILEIKPDTAQYIVDNTKIFVWLIKRLNPKTPFDDNKLYASEIFAMLVQNNKANQFTIGKTGGIEHLLNTLAVSF